MELLTDAQVADQIIVYENKIKVIKEKIRDELQIRRDLKAKIEEAKQREATQIQILERLDEYDKMVDKQLGLAEKKEDNESLKQLEIIGKYESMLEEQQKVWAKYEEEYEQLPLAKQRQQAELRLLSVTIQNKLTHCKLRDSKRIIKMKNSIDAQIEKIHIIQFAKLYVEYVKRRKRYQELVNKVQGLKLRERELQFEVRELEKKSEKDRLCFKPKNAMIQPQQLPQVDLSRFIIRRHWNNDNADTVSINSFMLEQEYMVTDEQSNKQVDSTQQKKLDNEKNCEDNIPMDLDIDDQPKDKLEQAQKSTIINGSERIIDNDRTIESNKRKNHRTGNQNVQPHHPDHIPKAQTSEGTCGNERRANNNSQNQQKMSQESFSETQRANERTTSKKRGASNHQQVEKETTQKSFMMNANHHQSMQQSSPYKIMNERSIPSPIKIPKHSSQEQQHQLSPMKSSEADNNYRDLSRLPQSNKPQITSSERVNIPNIQMHVQQQRHQQQQQQQQQRQKVETPNVNGAPFIPMDTSTTENTPLMFKEKQATSFSQLNSLNSFSMDFQSGGGVVTPNIAATSMMSTTMHSIDVNMFGDNLSAILGSEITEPGGSFELAKRIYADSDMNSDDGDFDYEKMIGKFCSPIATNPKVQQQQRAMENCNNHGSKPSSQETNERSFMFGNFSKKQAIPSQKFF